jgi:hypothetical protein
VRVTAILIAGLALFPSAGNAEVYYLIVGGLGGDAPYEERFAAHAQSLAQAARRTLGGDSRVSLLAGEEASREALTAALESLAETTTPADTLVAFFIGHGSFDGEQYKYNLPGPDIDGRTLGDLLEAVPAGRQLVVNATSASGAILETWAGERRTVITATRSGGERNATRFGEYWAAALADEEADVNKNGAITTREAFDYTQRKVSDSFESEGTLATEHSQLVGEAAGSMNVALLAERVATTAELERLIGELEALEAEIDALRLRRNQMQSEAYLDELQSLLLDLALVQRQIDEARDGD